MYLADHQIKKLVKSDNLINEEDFISEKTDSPSYGLSSFGYDARLGNEFVTFPKPGFFQRLFNLKGDIFDPTIHTFRENQDCFRQVSGYYDIKPGEFILAHTEEKFNFPPNITGVVKDKSTYARCGLSVQNTVLEAGWSGQVTIEISNHGPETVRLHAGRGIAQILFVHNPKLAEKPYTGKYQDQKGVVLPI
jgi:dCTP deaminase